MALFRCSGGNGGGNTLTAQYKIVISGASTCTITDLKTGKSQAISHAAAQSTTYTFGNLKIKYATNAWYWDIVDANGLYLAYCTANGDHLAIYTKEWQNSYTNTGTFYFRDSIARAGIEMIIPS